MGFDRRTAGRIVLVVLAAWALAVIVPSFYRLAVPLGSFGLSADNDGVVVDVTNPFDAEVQSPAARAGLREGDRVALRPMRCLPPGTARCRSLLSAIGGRNRIQYAFTGSTITLKVRGAAGGAVRNVTVRATRAPNHWPVLFVLVLDTAGGIFFIAVAFALAWRRPSRMTWGFFLYSLWFNPGQNFTFYAFLQHWPLAVLLQEVAEALAQGAGFAGLFTLALRFPGNRLERKWRRLDSLLPVLGAVFALLATATYASAFGFGTETITRVMLLFGFVINGTILAVLFVRRRSLGPLDEQRMRWVIAGAALGLPALILGKIAQSSGLLVDVWGGSASEVVIGLLYLVNGVLAYFVAAAVRRRRVVSLAIPLRRGSVATLVTLVLGVPVVYAHERLAAYHEGFHLPEWAWLFVVGPIVVIVLHRLQERLVALVERIFVRTYYRAKHRLEAATETMERAMNPAEVDRILVQECTEALELASGALFRRENGEVHRGAYAPGWERVRPMDLASDPDGVVARGLGADRPLRLPRAERDSPGLPKGVAAPCLTVPLGARAGGADAVLVFGAHRRGTDISTDESEMLHELAIRAAEIGRRIETRLLRREVEALRAELAGREQAGSGTACARG